jgi:hypothetical protein
MTALATILASAVRPDDIRAIRRAVPGYEESRERGAALVAKGLDINDAYQRNRKWIFTGALCGMGASGFLWWKRRRIPEAHGLYGITFTLSTLTAYLTRPPKAPAAVTTAAPATAPVPTAQPSTPVPASEAPSQPGGFIGWLDAERARRAKSDPLWADKAMSRAVTTDVLRPTWQRLPDYLRALVL